MRAAPPKRILLVEDSPTQAAEIRFLIELAGGDPGARHVDHVLTLADALALATAGTYDVVLCDLTLPDARDLEAVHAIVAAAPGVPLVVLTALDSEGLAVQAVQAGAQDYLTKEGLSADSLLRAMRYAVERHRLSTEYRSFFALAADLFCIMAPDGSIELANPAWEATLGHGEDVLPGTRLQDLAHPDDRNSVATALVEAAHADAPVTFECRVRGASGNHRWLLWNAIAPLGQEHLFASGRDITERREAEDAIQRAREQAEEANHAKTTFLSRMSHELRTPLNAVLGFGQLLEESRLDTNDRESVGLIMDAGRHLLDLINEVLDIARLEVGRTAFYLEPIKVTEIVGKSLDLVRPLAEQQGVELRDETEGLDVVVQADHQRLQQVLLNLLSNAAKYNTDGGSVTVSCARTDDRVHLAVSDTGVGIPRSRMQRLYEPFERLGAEASGVEGTGLGLALSRDLVTGMGGTIAIDSTEGEGTTVTLDLPAATSAPPAPSGAGAQPSTQTAPVVPGTKVLYVEDNLANARLMEKIMERRPGAELMTAMTGRLGLELARQHHPDLVLLDSRLPDIHGRDVLAQLRADAHTADIPVVVVTAEVFGDEPDRLMAAGADAFVAKPIDVADFLHTLDGFLSRR